MSKNKICVLFLLILTICTFSFFNVKANKLPLFNKIIYLDAGHGGVDPGAIYKDIYEKDINLSIALKLKEKLEQQGATIYMTRYGDYDISDTKAKLRKRSDLTNRYRIINDAKPDIYISIHLNSITSSTWRGAQVFYTNKNDNNQILGEIIQKQLKQDLNTEREAKKFSGALMNDNIKIPGILIEAGFLSNENDRYNLKQDDYQYKIADSIVKGVITYFNQNS